MSNPSLVAVVDIETLAQGHDAVIGAIGVVIVDVAQLRAVDEFLLPGGSGAGPPA